MANGRTGGTVEPLTDGFGSKCLGPQGFPLADDGFVGRFARCTTSRRTGLRADRLAIEEAEPSPSSPEPL